MTQGEPSSHVAAFDLDDSLEFHVLELSAIAGCVHDGSRSLQQCRDFGDSEEAVVWDAADQCSWDEGLRQSCVSRKRAFRCIGLHNCRARGRSERLRFQRLDSGCIAMHILIGALPRRRSPVRTRCSAPYGPGVLEDFGAFVSFRRRRRPCWS